MVCGSRSSSRARNDLRSAQCRDPSAPRQRSGDIRDPHGASGPCGKACPNPLRECVMYLATNGQCLGDPEASPVGHHARASSGRSPVSARSSNFSSSGGIMQQLDKPSVRRGPAFAVLGFVAAAVFAVIPGACAEPSSPVDAQASAAPVASAPSFRFRPRSVTGWASSAVSRPPSITSRQRTMPSTAFRSPVAWSTRRLVEWGSISERAARSTAL